jgi:predicted MFS family arabinose efflux permease
MELHPATPNAAVCEESMSRKSVYVGMTVGSTIGGFVPALWHASLFSMSAIVMSMVGGIAGIWIAYRLGRG